MFEKFGSEKVLTLSASLILIFTTIITTIITILASLPLFVNACPPGVDFCGGVGIIASPGGSSGGSSSLSCGNNITSCGTSPNCVDLSQISYCVNGHLVQPYCWVNKPQNRTTSSACLPTTNFILKAKGHDGSDKQLTLTFFSPGTTSNPILISTLTGNATVASPLPIVDSEIDFDNSYLRIFMKGLNVTSLQSGGTNGTSQVNIERITTAVTIPGASVDKSYLVEFPSSFSFKSLVLNLSYIDVSVNNASNLVLYRCGSYNFATNNCDSGWQLKTGVTIDTANKILSVPLTGFSVYSLAEQGATTTTTSSTSSTTSTSTQSSNTNSNTPSDLQPLTSVETVGNVCNKNSDCCDGKSSGSYVCTPGGCAPCDPSQGNCFSCAPQTTTTSNTPSSTSSTSSTTKANTMTFSLPSFSFPAMPSLFASIGQSSLVTFILGFTSGFIFAWLFKSGFTLPSLPLRSFGLPSRRRFTATRYGKISSSGKTNGNGSARRYKSYGETKLILN